MEMQQQKSEYTGCNNCKHTNVDARDYPCNECKHAVTTFDHYEPQTNADRIRNMTDEELAEYFKIVQEHTIKSQQVDSIEDMLQFLQAEVKEGAENE